MFDCFYVKNIPDIPNKLLLSQLYQFFGYCKVDIFRKFGWGEYNMGSCKIFLHREVAQDLSLFHIVPCEQICLDIGFTHLISIRRWVRNNFSVQTPNFALSSKELSSENDVQ